MNHSQNFNFKPLSSSVENYQNCDLEILVQESEEIKENIEEQYLNAKSLLTKAEESGTEVSTDILEDLENLK